MVIRNRIISLIYRIIAAIIGIFTIIFIFYSDSANSFSWNPFRFLGTTITTFSTIVLILEVLINGISFRSSSKRIFGIYGQMLYVAVGLETALALTQPVFYLFINGGNISVPYFSADRIFTQLSLYIIFPFVVFFDWLLFSEKGNWKYHWIIYLLSIPLFYTAFSVLNHYIRTSTTFATAIFDNNTFLNYAILGGLNGWVGVIIASMTTLAIYIAIGMGFVFLSNLLSGKYHRNPVI